MDLKTFYLEKYRMYQVVLFYCPFLLLPLILNSLHHKGQFYQIISIISFCHLSAAYS